ncbi:leucine-rich repeat domain-containing protein [Dysgonomonas sp. 25]|uniref:leucine-rich repeat domain-containing protein n=1 Tax=Dysgonomonas sp. 25 TaxID=2302933 RepID=UPI001628FF5A|nr:hypothetical protein [Dysgonomonas sp. 25]
MKQKILTQVIVIMALFTVVSSMRAQVTIGSNQPPMKGALLDLTEGAITTKGLNLPRVELTKLNPTTPAELAASIGNNSNSYDLDKHIGLLVYNINDVPECGYPAGLFVWGGEQWQQLSGGKAGRKIEGSYAEDVQALKDLYNANPGNPLGWNLSGDPTTFGGVTWKTICGEKRVTVLDIRYAALTSSTGIGKLYALTALHCNVNQLTSLDVSSCTALTDLHCSGNQLTSLDISQNTALANLNCSSNYLTSLDISQNTALTYCTCSDNQLTSLDVSSNTALLSLNCYDNQLTSLDVSSNTALAYCACYGNQLTSLDVSSNTALLSLSCYGNELSQIEVNKFKLQPNYCPNISNWRVTPQYFSGTTTIDFSIIAPTCP